MAKPEPAHRIYRSRKDLFIDNLLGGIAWGFGGVIGATVVVAIIGIIIARLETTPLLGAYISSLLEEVQRQQQNFQ